MMTWPEVLELARKANDHYSLTERQQELVWELAMMIPEGGTIVELGVAHGKTAVILAAAAANKNARYLGVDNWSLEGTMSEVSDLLSATGLPACWELANHNTHEPQEEEEGSLFLPLPCPSDLLLIDAGHDEENVRQDCEVWLPQVREGGIVIFDDVPSGPGWETSCHNAVRFNMEKWCSGWEFAAGFGKVMAWRKPIW